MQLEQGQPRRLVNSLAVRTDYRLLECSEELLAAIVTEGVVIKGAGTDEAVLCTANKTFAVKYVETTNMQLLVAPCTAQGQVHAAHASQRGSQDDENVPPILSLPGLQTQLCNLADGSSRAPAVVVAATNQAHLEVVEIAPRLEVLEHLLSRRPYGLQDEEEQEQAQGAAVAEAEAGQGRGEDSVMEQGDGQRPAGGEEGRTEAAAAKTEGLYSFEDLLERVQASAAEVRSGLQALGAVQLGAHWRLIEPSYLGGLLEILISSAQQEGYPLDAVPGAGICASLRDCGYEEAVVMHCLTTFGAPAAANHQQQQQQQQQQQGDAMDMDDDGGSGRSKSGCWALDEKKVCIHFAAKLLAGTSWQPLDGFQAAWSKAVPEGMQPDLEMLKGEALVQGKGAAATIKHFCARSLPRDPARCFETLFAERPKWDHADLEPYLMGLKVPGLNSKALLLKYTRASQPAPDAPVTYTAR